MKNPFNIGDTKTFTHKVGVTDTATFNKVEIHSVYSSFALARDAEWTCRLFVLDMKEEDEEGIGTHITVKHIAPALINDVVTFIATIESISENEIICNYEAKVNNRLIATGKQGQKILKKEKIKKLFEGFKNG